MGTRQQPEACRASSPSIRKRTRRGWPHEITYGQIYMNRSVTRLVERSRRRAPTNEGNLAAEGPCRRSVTLGVRGRGSSARPWPVDAAKEGRCAARLGGNSRSSWKQRPCRSPEGAGRSQAPSRVMRRDAGTCDCSRARRQRPHRRQAERRNPGGLARRARRWAPPSAEPVRRAAGRRRRRGIALAGRRGIAQIRPRSKAAARRRRAAVLRDARRPTL
jgi:hypothetical protein